MFALAIYFNIDCYLRELTSTMLKVTIYALRTYFKAMPMVHLYRSVSYFPKVLLQATSRDVVVTGSTVSTSRPKNVLLEHQLLHLRSSSLLFLTDMLQLTSREVVCQPQASP